MAVKKTTSPLPFLPAQYDEATIGAIKALAAGNANEGQQKRALDWIIYTLCGTYDQPYRPGEGGDRDTVFACAKQFVGQQIVKMTKITTQERRGG
jgi:hypothetical protein